MGGKNSAQSTLLIQASFSGRDAQALDTQNELLQAPQAGLFYTFINASMREGAPAVSADAMKSANYHRNRCFWPLKCQNSIKFTQKSQIRRDAQRTPPVTAAQSARAAEQRRAAEAPMPPPTGSKTTSGGHNIARREWAASAPAARLLSGGVPKLLQTLN